MPNIVTAQGHALGSPRLVVMDLLGVFVEHDETVRRALAAAFSAHGEHVDEEVAAMAIGYPGVHGISRLLKWLHPNEEPSAQSVRSIHDLAVKEFGRMVRFGNAIQPASGIHHLCQNWGKVGVHMAATTTLDSAVVKSLLSRMGWDSNPPFHALVLAEEVDHPTPGPDLILECMRRTGVQDVKAVAKVASHVIGLSDARRLRCGWNVLVDDGTLTTDQIAAIAPSAIVDQVSHLSNIWTFPAQPDAAMEDDIARLLARP